MGAGALAITALAGSAGDTQSRATAAAVPAAAAAAPAVGDACVPVGTWRMAGSAPAQPATTADVVKRALAAKVVLLGESHDSHEHHRWQLQTLAALHARHPDLVIALEMFPRRAQRALDRWVSGGVDEAQFLNESGWRETWGFDAALYLPIFHFARMNRIPLVAVNLDRGVMRAVAERGLAAVPPAERGGVGDPAPALPAYEQVLFDSWLHHLPPGEDRGSRGRDDPAFRRFLESQLLWDRAIAQGVAEAAARHPGAVVAALMGSAHVIHGWGVPQQLRALGRPAPLTLLPFDREDDCTALAGGLADALFGVAAPAPAATPPRPRLGVTIEAAEGGVRIAEVASGSIAERAGLRKGDVILTIAGRRAGRAADVAGAVMRQAPGTWLPIEVQRGGRRLEIVARFPPAPDEP